MDAALTHPTATTQEARSMLGLDLHTWEVLMLISLGIAAIAAVAVVGTTTAVVLLQRDALRESSERIAMLNERAALAQQEFVKFKEPRSRILEDPSNGALVVEKLSPFPGTKFDLGFPSSGREIWDFVWKLEPLLDKAGWVFLDWAGPQRFLRHRDALHRVGPPKAGARHPTTENWYGMANVLNVSIEIYNPHRAQLLPAAEALAKALNDLGIATTVEAMRIGSTSENPDAVHVLVGEKR